MRVEFREELSNVTPQHAVSIDAYESKRCRSFAM